MYSKPTNPSGKSATAASNDTTEMIAMSARFRKPHGSARSTYHVRTPSKPSVNLLTIHHGRHAECSDHRPASVGVTVNETKSEVSVAAVTTRPNSRSESPTVPGRNESGRKTTTSTSVITIAATPISFRPSTAAVSGSSPS